MLRRVLLLRARLVVRLLRLMLRLVVLLRLLMLRLLMLRLMLLRLIVLRLIVLRLIVLRLIVLLPVARIKRLLRRVWLAHLRLIVVVVAIVGKIVIHPAAWRLLLLEIGLTLPKLFLRRGDQTEIMFGVLIVMLGGDRVSGALRVAGELEIFFRDVGRRAPYFYVLPIGLVQSRQRILVMTTFTITTAHALVLTVSHVLQFRQPHYGRRH
jgi:hypothetical protein